MRKQTTTKQLYSAITNNLLQIKKAEIYHKISRKTETIPNDKFLECFDFFCKAGIFADCIGWHFERNRKTDNYEVECCRMNGDVDIIVTVYLRVRDGVRGEEIEKALLFEEE